MRPLGPREPEEGGPDPGLTDHEVRAPHRPIAEPPARCPVGEQVAGESVRVLEPNGNGTTVTVHQRRLPAELQTERARLGLSGILDQLDALIAELTRQRPQTDE